MACSEDAKRTLAYYFRLLFERAGLKWTSDNEAEIEGLVDDIILAVRLESEI